MPINHKTDVQYGANIMTKLLLNEVEEKFITIKYEQK
jgi:hypothetical protein